MIIHIQPVIAIIMVFAMSFFSDKVWAHEGWGIVVDRKGQIYFSDIPTNTIWRITREGNLEKVLRKHCHALILGEDGSIYGTQENHAQAVGNVWKIAPDGSFSIVFSPKADYQVSLHPFIIDREGNIYSTNSISFPNQNGKVTLLKRTPDGNVTIIAGSYRGHKDGQGNNAQFSGIDGMAWATDGSLYLTDSVYLRLVSMDGVVTTLGGGALTEQVWGEDLMGLSVSTNGSIYVADYSKRRVLQLMPGGQIVTILKTGFIWSPTGITHFGKDIYLLEHLRMPLVILGDIGVGAYVRIRKFSPDGTVATIAMVWGRNTMTAVLGGIGSN